MECEKCGKQVDESFNLCPYCGETIEKQLTCNNCGAVIKKDYSFCPRCGNQFIVPKPTPKNDSSSILQLSISEDKRIYQSFVIKILIDIIILVLTLGCAILIYLNLSQPTNTVSALDFIGGDITPTPTRTRDKNDGFLPLIFLLFCVSIFITFTVFLIIHIQNALKTRKSIREKEETLKKIKSQ